MLGMADACKEMQMRYERDQMDVMADEIELLRGALRELASVAAMVQNSTDRDHWRRLDRAIDQALKLIDKP